MVSNNVRQLTNCRMVFVCCITRYMKDKIINSSTNDSSRTVNTAQETIYKNLAQSAKNYPNKDAIIFYGHRISYTELKNQVDYFAGFLQEQCDVKKNDRIVLFLQNSPQFVIAYQAIVRAQGIIVPVNPMNLAADLSYYVKDSESKVIITTQDLMPKLKSLIKTKAIQHTIVATFSDYIDTNTKLALPDSVAAPKEHFEEPNVHHWKDVIDAKYKPLAYGAKSTDICVLPYTSGTTGKPKGCMITNGNLLHTALAPAQWINLKSESTVLCSLPLFHATGMQGSMNQPIYAGSTVIIMTRWDRTTAAMLIEKYRISNWTCVPTMATDFLSNPELKKFDLSSLKRIGGGGATMPESLAIKMLSLTGIEYREAYGLSETIGATHMNPQQRPKRKSIGIPIFSTESMIIDPDTKEKLDFNKTGEIIIRGPQVFNGYWNNESASAKAFVEIDNKIFFRSGDLGYRDKEGYFFVVDRIKRMINASGLKVWPAEIEAVLHGHPNISEVCVIGTKDSYRGESVKAIVVLQKEKIENLQPDDIISWARTKMAAYKIPRVVEFTKSLPKTATGKIMWRQLQELENSKR